MDGEPANLPQSDNGTSVIRDKVTVAEEDRSIVSVHQRVRHFIDPVRPQSKPVVKPLARLLSRVIHLTTGHPFVWAMAST